MKYLIFVIPFLFATHAFATDQFRVTTTTGHIYHCDSLESNYCIVFQQPVNGQTTLGYGTLQEWTGLYDTTGTPVYAGDSVTSVTTPPGVIMWGYPTVTGLTYLGWIIHTQNGSNYFLFANAKITIQ